MNIKPTINYEDFSKLDIRVGEVTKAINLENSNKLIELTVDFGEQIGTKTILTAMRKWHEPTKFINQKFPFLINLEEKKMAGSVSQGMILSGDDIDGNPILLNLNDIETGTIIR